MNVLTQTEKRIFKSFRSMVTRRYVCGWSCWAKDGFFVYALTSDCGSFEVSVSKKIDGLRNIPPIAWSGEFKEVTIEDNLSRFDIQYENGVYPAVEHATTGFCMEPAPGLPKLSGAFFRSLLAETKAIRNAFPGRYYYRIGPAGAFAIGKYVAVSLPVPASLFPSRESCGAMIPIKVMSVLPDIKWNIVFADETCPTTGTYLCGSFGDMIVAFKADSRIASSTGLCRSASRSLECFGSDEDVTTITWGDNASGEFNSCVESGTLGFSWPVGGGQVRGRAPAPGKGVICGRAEVHCSHSTLVGRTYLTFLIDPKIAKYLLSVSPVWKVCGSRRFVSAENSTRRVYATWLPWRKGWGFF